MGSRAAGTMKVWRKWTLHHKDIAKKRRNRHAGTTWAVDQKASSNQGKRRKSLWVAEVLDMQYHFYFGSLYFKQRSTIAQEFRENHSHNLIPEGMDARGTFIQENEFLQLCNSEKDNYKNENRQIWRCGQLARPISVPHRTPGTLSYLISCQR